MPTTLTSDDIAADLFQRHLRAVHTAARGLLSAYQEYVAGNIDTLDEATEELKFAADEAERELPGVFRKGVAGEPQIDTTRAAAATKPAFIARLVYRSSDGKGYPGATSSRFSCYSPDATGDYSICDCWVCDESGRVDPGFNVSPVPVCREALGAVVGKRRG